MKTSAVRRRHGGRRVRLRALQDGDVPRDLPESHAIEDSAPSRSDARRACDRSRQPDPDDWLREHRPSLVLGGDPATVSVAAPRRPAGDRLRGGGPLAGRAPIRPACGPAPTPGCAQALASLGLADHWFLPLLLVVILLGWQVVSSHDWRFSPAILAGMVVESLVWAVALLGISRLIDLGFSYLEQGGTPLLAVDRGAPDRASIALDRLPGRRGLRGDALPPDSGPHLLRHPPTACRCRRSWRAAGRSPARRLLFALAHHAGSPGEPFTWFAFIFRWMAGVFFAWVFVLRGFGIAVGTHTAVRYPGRLDRLACLRTGLRRDAGRPDPSRRANSLRIVHLSDIHFWQYAFNPLRLMSKRLVGMASLLAGRARRFRLERVPRAGRAGAQPRRRPYPDHRRPDDDGPAGRVPGGAAALGRLAGRPGRVTIIPGNHDRYTLVGPSQPAVRAITSVSSPRRPLSLAARLDPGHGDPGARPDPSGRLARAGNCPDDSSTEAREIARRAAGREQTALVIACHYPVAVPPRVSSASSRGKPLVNAAEVRRVAPGRSARTSTAAATSTPPGPSGPPAIPNQLCLNPGAPLLRDTTGRRPPDSWRSRSTDATSTSITTPGSRIRGSRPAVPAGRFSADGTRSSSGSSTPSAHEPE